MAKGSSSFINNQGGQMRQGPVINQAVQNDPQQLARVEAQRVAQENALKSGYARTADLGSQQSNIGINTGQTSQPRNVMAMENIGGGSVQRRNNNVRPIFSDKEMKYKLK